jgi:hypothetical protein
VKRNPPVVKRTPVRETTNFAAIVTRGGMAGTATAIGNVRGVTRAIVIASAVATNPRIVVIMKPAATALVPNANLANGPQQKPGPMRLRGPHNSRALNLSKPPRRVRRPRRAILSAASAAAVHGAVDGDAAEAAAAMIALLGFRSRTRDSLRRLTRIRRQQHPGVKHALKAPPKRVRNPSLRRRRARKPSKTLN